MPNITAVIARVFVDDLDQAVPLYQTLSGVTEVRRFRFRDVELASVGPFLLLSGDTAPYRNRVATLQVEQLEPVIAAIERAGGQVLEGPSPAGSGERLIARHPDGSVFEYLKSGE